MASASGSSKVPCKRAQGQRDSSSALYQKEMTLLRMMNRLGRSTNVPNLMTSSSVRHPPPQSPSPPARSGPTVEEDVWVPESVYAIFVGMNNDIQRLDAALKAKTTEATDLHRRVAQLEAKVRYREGGAKYDQLAESMRALQANLGKAQLENGVLKVNLDRQKDKAQLLQDLLKDSYQSVIDLRLQFNEILKSRTDGGADLGLDQTINKLVEQLEKWEEKGNIDFSGFHANFQAEVKTMKNLLIGLAPQLSKDCAGKQMDFEEMPAVGPSSQADRATPSPVGTGIVRGEQNEDEVMELSEPQEIEILVDNADSRPGLGQDAVVVLSSPACSPSKAPVTVVHGVDESRLDQGFYCLCDLSFRVKEHLNHHLKYFTSEKKFVCTYGCGKSFVGASYLRKHMQKAHKINIGSTFGCRDCGEWFHSRLELGQHRKQNHSQVTPQKQQVEQLSDAPTPPLGPGPVEPEVQTQQLHFVPAAASTAPPAQGDESSTSFADELISDAYVSSAGKLHGTDEKKRHLGAYCICGQLCANLNALHHHVWYRNSKTKFVCTICRRTYPGQSYLNKHMYGAHKLIPMKSNNVTTILSTSQPQGQQRRGLRRTVSRFREQHAIDPTICDGQFHCKCGLKFNTSSRLSSHIQHFKGAPKFRCRSCGKGFVAMGYLKKHMKRMHNICPTKTLGGCIDCGKVFDTNQEYELHRKIHHKKRVSKSDKQQADDQQHGYTELIDLEPVPARPPYLYHCKCGKTFSMEKNLVMHIRNNSNGRLFWCEWCPRRFINHGGLKKHMANIHPNVEYNKKFGCRQCGRTFVLQEQLFFHCRTVHPRNQSGQGTSEAAVPAQVANPVISEAEASTHPNVEDVFVED